MDVQSPPPPPPGFELIEPTSSARADTHRPANRGTAIAIVAGAVGTDLAMWSGRAGIGWAIGSTTAALAIALAARPTRRGALVLLAAVPVLGALCVVRASPWVVVPNVIAINGCLLLAATSASRGREFDLSLPRLLVRVCCLIEELVASFPWLRGVFPSREHGTPPPPDRHSRVIGLVLAVPVVITLAALLASADPVFASFFDLGLDAEKIAGHATFLVGGAWAMMALLRAAAATEDEHESTAHPSAAIGNVVLAAITVVFGLFAASRLLALTGTAEHIAETRGLTWAEHARSGFFQLLAVAAITLAVLLFVRGWSTSRDDRQHKVMQRLALIDVVLVIGIVVDAVYRLVGYENAYGLTVLRLYSMCFAIWIAVVFLIVGGSFLGSYDGRKWLTPMILTTALGALLTMNAINPEAVVAERNMTGPTKAGETDAYYLANDLDSDARPTIDRFLAELPAADQDIVRIEGCGDAAERPWYEFNLADRTGDRIERAWCRGG